MSRRTIATIAALALGMTASACSGGKESQREEEAPAQAAQVTEPKAGIVTAVDSQRLFIDSADDPGDEEAIFERTTRSIVMREGMEIGWNQLSEGDAVRVTWDRGVFGPDRVAQVEVLSGNEAARVRQQVEQEMGLDQDETFQPMQPREIEPPIGDPSFPPPGGDLDPADPNY